MRLLLQNLVLTQVSLALMQSQAVKTGLITRKEFGG